MTGEGETTDAAGYSCTLVYGESYCSLRLNVSQDRSYSSTMDPFDPHGTVTRSTVEYARRIMRKGSAVEMRLRYLIHISTEKRATCNATDKVGFSHPIPK